MPCCHQKEVLQAPQGQLSGSMALDMTQNVEVALLPAIPVLFLQQKQAEYPQHIPKVHHTPPEKVPEHTCILGREEKEGPLGSKKTKSGDGNLHPERLNWSPE